MVCKKGLESRIGVVLEGRWEGEALEEGEWHSSGLESTVADEWQGSAGRLDEVCAS